MFYHIDQSRLLAILAWYVICAECVSVMGHGCKTRQYGLLLRNRNASTCNANEILFSPSIKWKKVFITITYLTGSFSPYHGNSVCLMFVMRILKAYDVPPNLLQAKETMYACMNAQRLRQWRQMVRVVMQGNMHFRKAINGREPDHGFTLKPKRSRRQPAQVLTDLDHVGISALLQSHKTFS